MADRPDPCARVRADAPELALGVLEGPARGEALAHVAACEACRAHVRELADVVDLLVALAPEAEPPPGFESTVVARMAAGRPVRGRGRSRVRLAAAAAVLVLVGAAAGALLGGRGGSDDGETLDWAAMVAPGGDEVGEVWRYGDEEATLVVSVPAWAEIEGTDGPRYALRLALEGGGTVEVGDFGRGDGRSSWGVTTEVAADAITAVSVVDDTGRVWCTGDLA